jgi:uncharacterized delta-60 repeat protein
MNNRIWHYGLVAVAVTVVALVGFALLAGNDSGAQLTPSSALAQALGLAPPVAVAMAGGLDPSFGRDGKVVTNLTHSHWDDWASALAIQADGKIVLAGGARYRVARLNSDGTLDATFGVDGKVMTGFTSGSDSASGVAIQADRKIVVVGEDGSGRRAQSDTKFALARYNSDGTLDASFGVNGKVMTDFTPRGDGAAGVAIQADGKIVVAGMANSGRSKMKVALARYVAAAVGSPSTASAVASSPSPHQSATASSISDGVYLVGTDIPAGSYKGTTVSDTFSAWQISSDANGSSIIASDPATSGQFYVQVKQGQCLKLSGVQIVNAAAAAPTKMRSSVGDGVYLVGTDIPAGSYRETSGDYFAGSLQISRDANGTLVVSDNPTVARPFYSHVKKGQYLRLFELKVRRVK